MFNNKIFKLGLLTSCIGCNSEIGVTKMKNKSPQRQCYDIIDQSLSIIIRSDSSEKYTSNFDLGGKKAMQSFLIRDNFIFFLMQQWNIYNKFNESPQYNKIITYALSYLDKLSGYKLSTVDPIRIYFLFYIFKQHFDNRYPLKEDSSCDNDSYIKEFISNYVKELRKSIEKNFKIEPKRVIRLKDPNFEDFKNSFVEKMINLLSKRRLFLKEDFFFNSLCSTSTKIAIGKIIEYELMENYIIPESKSDEFKKNNLDPKKSQESEIDEDEYKDNVPDLPELYAMQSFLEEMEIHRYGYKEEDEKAKKRRYSQEKKEEKKKEEDEEKESSCEKKLRRNPRRAEIRKSLNKRKETFSVSRGKNNQLIIEDKNTGNKVSVSHPAHKKSKDKDPIVDSLNTSLSKKK